jgi:2-C-methyl-D-erythritol 4-phosphate cytidylyltransferase
MDVGVVLAAGMGSRVGADGNKAYLRLAGRAMLAWSLQSVASTPGIGRTVLVYRRGERDLAEATVAADLPSAAIEFVEGGDTRHGSELNVLRYLAPDIDSGAVEVVLIHDGARPLAGRAMMTTALAVARQVGGAVPAIAAPDVVRGEGGLAPVAATGTPVRVQTPQAFRAAPLLAAYRAAEAAGFEGTDTSSCLEQFSELQVRTFPGALSNLKVTYAHDLAVAERLLRELVS